jgi:outer membrane biosynthesis protein TonB
MQLRTFVKRIILILLFAFFVVGCGGDVPETAVEPTAEQVEVATNDDAVEDPTVESTAEPEETAVVEEEVEEPTAEPEEEPTEEPTAEPEEEETAVEAEPIALGDPTQIRDSDWVHGAEDARVVIIEYGDFQ